MNFGELIRSKRIEKDLTLEEVGNAVGVGKSTVRKWETGQIKNIRRDKLAALGKLLDIPPAQLVDTQYIVFPRVLGNEESHLLHHFRALSLDEQIEALNYIDYVYDKHCKQNPIPPDKDPAFLGMEK